jgi:CheY-like chemotaxis protein
VDDDADALEMARTVLARAGALVTAASNANDALAALDQAEFDAGILDLGMPQVDGYELLRRIRSRSEDRQRPIPLAALSAYARPVDRARSLQSGFQLHLTKPVIPSELTAAVRALSDELRPTRT